MCLTEAGLIEHKSDPDKVQDIFDEEFLQLTADQNSAIKAGYCLPMIKLHITSIFLTFWIFFTYPTN